MEYLQTAITEAINALITSATLFVPRLINALILLLIGWLIAKVLSTLLDKLLARFGFDRLLGRSGFDHILSEAGVTVGPGYALARLVYWLIFLFFVLAAVDVLGLQAAAEALRQLIGYMPNLIATLLVIIGGGVLARFLGQTAQALAAGANLEFNRILGLGVRYFLLILTFIIAAGQLGLDVSFLGGALVNLIVVVVAALGLGFALGGKSVIHNILAGYYAKDIYQLGQRIQIQNHQGTLEAIGPLKATILANGQNITLPNSLLISEVVIENAITNNFDE